MDQKHCFILCNFADLRFADWETKEICGFAICGCIITNFRICDLRTGIPQIFADLRLQNEPKNLRICDLRTNKQILRAHLYDLFMRPVWIFAQLILNILTMREAGKMLKSIERQ